MNLERARVLQLAAQLYYIDRLDQAEVARLVGVSRSQVSRLLQAAREEGIVRITVDAYEPRNLDLEESLRSQLHLRHAIVVRSPDTTSKEQVRRNIGYFAAPVLAALIKPRLGVGLAGGRTLAEVIRHIPVTGDMPGVTVATLMGNIDPSVSPVDAMELSHTLARRCKGTLYVLNAPALAPNAATLDAFLSHEQVQSVYGLFKTLDIAFVGLGTIIDSLFFERGVLSSADGATLVRQGAVGEICGHYFDRHGNECETGYWDRVLAISLEDLRRVPDVVAVTSGADRAEAVHAAIAGHLINSLVIDEAGASAVIALANAQQAGAVTTNQGGR